MHRENENFDVRCNSAYFAGGFNPVYARHTYVENYEIRLERLNLFNSFFAISAPLFNEVLTGRKTLERKINEAPNWDYG